MTNAVFAVVGLRRRAASSLGSALAGARPYAAPIGTLPGPAIRT